MKYFLITIFLSLSFFSKAQYTNSLTLPLYGSWFLDRNPYKLNRHFIENGFEYKKKIGKEKKHGIYVSLVYFLNDYRLKVKEQNESWLAGRTLKNTPENSFFETETSFINIGYYKRIVDKKRYNFDLKSGLNYRFLSTNLLLVRYYAAFGEAVIQNVYFDNSFGANIGCDINITIYNHLSATLGISYSRFFNNQTIRSQYDGSYIKDPQRNTLVTGFGLTYGFGKKKR
jgi:hypothetical protein